MSLVQDFSWFSIHKLENVNDWEILLVECGWHDVRRAQDFHQRLSVERTIWAIHEREYVEKDYRSIYSYYYSKVFSDYPRSVSRVHFWETEIEAPEFALNIDRYSDKYIGFSCLFDNEFPLIGRSIWNPKKFVPSSRVMHAKFEVNVFGTQLQIEAFPFIQQDTNIMSCAQASVWMVLRYFSEKYSFYRDVFPHEIAQARLIHGFGRSVPSSGLQAWEICDVISRFGFHPENHSLDAYRIRGETERFLEVLHRYLESGIPVVLGSSSKAHAIVAVGIGTKKTSYRDVPVTRGGITYVPAWRYYDSLVVNDDNLLPYSLLTDTGGNINLSDVDSLIVPLYEKIYLSGRDAENVGLRILANPDIGIKAIGDRLEFSKKFLNNDTLVIRTLLTSSRSFRNYHMKTGGMKSSSYLYRLGQMPKFIWIVEISNDTLFKQDMKFAEIIIDATSSKRSSSPFLFIRYPGLMIKNDNRATISRDEWDLTGENPVEPLYENLT